MQQKQSVKVWDLGIRVFHWSLVLAIIYSYFTVEVINNVVLHAYGGWAVCSLLLFRLIWGLVVWPLYANPVHMRKSALLAKSYTKGLLHRKAPVYLGHNPVGVWAVFGLLGLLGLLVLTGTMMEDDFVAGSLYAFVPHWLSNVAAGMHELLFNLLLTLVVVHIAGVAYYTIFKKQALVPAMLHGYKRLRDGQQTVDYAGDQPAGAVFMLRAGIALLISLALAVWLFAVWLG